jgi:predicted nucleic acid-binding protein
LHEIHRLQCIQYAADSKNPVKRSIARKLISVAVASGGCKINVQVLNEFSSVAHRKLGLTIDEIKAYLEMFRALTILPVPADVTEKGLAVMQRYGLQFYDSLLLVAASEAVAENSSLKILTTDRFIAA